MALSKSALDLIVSNEDVMLQETVVPPVDSPSASQVVAPDTVVSTEPVETTVAIDPVAAPAEIVTPAVDIPVVQEVGTVVEPAPTAAVVETVVAPEVVEPLNVGQVVETQNPTAILGQATQEVEVCQERADELLAMQHALEQYGKLLKQTGLEGISEQGAAFMQVGMEMIQRSLGTNVTVSQESFGDINPRSNRVFVTVSAESVKELAGKAFDAFIEAIKKLVELMKKGWEEVKHYATDQDETIHDLLERLKTLKGHHDGKVTIDNPSMLFADGTLVFPDFKAISGLTHFALVAYPKAMEEYFNKIDKFIRTLDVEETSDEEIEMQLDAIAKPLEALTNDSSVKELFNGNHEIDVTALSFGIKRGEGKEAPNSVELEVIAPVGLRKLLVEMRIANGLMKDHRESNERVVKAANKVVATAEQKKGTGQLSQKVLKLVQQASPRNREIAEFVSRVTRAYLAVINKMVDVSASDQKKDK